MFFIDYSLPWYSRYLLYLDAPFRYSFRHLIFYYHNKAIEKHTGVVVLSRAQRVAHFCIAFLEAIPILGVVTGLIDWLIFRRPLRRVQAADPEELDFMIHKILPIYKAISTSRNNNPYKEAKKLEAYIPERYIAEMKTLAQSSKIAYDEILLANTIFDFVPLFAATSCAIAEEGGICRALGDFYADANAKSILRMLRKLNVRDTVNTVIFDVNARSVRVGIGSDYTANRRVRRFSAKKLFGDTGKIDGPCIALLGQNLNVPMALFAPLTRLFVRGDGRETHRSASLGLPGIIGTYSGMNEKGLALVASSVPSTTQEGIPSQLLFRKILDEAKSLHEALKIIDKAKPASAATLLLAARDGIAKVELDPAKKSIGASVITY